MYPQEKEISSKIIKSLVYEDLGGSEAQQIEGLLEKIQKTNTGKDIIDYINSKNEHFVIKVGNHQAVQPPKRGKPLTLILNPKDFSKDIKSPCLGKLYEDETGKFVSIGQSDIPFFIALGHELLHVKHFFEDEEKYTLDSARIDNTYWPVYDDKGYRLGNIWHDLEEQRTVIGKMNISEICELTLRKDENIAPRYAYQDFKDHFYEDRELMLNILKRYDIDLEKNNDFTRYEWLFDEAIAKSSRLNSLTYQEKYAELYEKQKEEKLASETMNESEADKLKKRQKEMQERLEARRKKK
jgi:hypothetical protein